MPHSLQQLPEGWRSRKVSAQHNRVQKITQELFAAGAISPCRIASDQNVFLPAVTQQENVECRQQHHVERDALFPAKSAEGIAQRRRQSDRLQSSAKSLLRRPSS